MTKKPEPEDFGIPRDDLPRWHLEAPRRRGRAAAVIAGLIVLVSLIGCSGSKGGLIVGLLLPFVPPFCIATLIIVGWLSKEVAEERYPRYFEFCEALTNYHRDQRLADSALFHTLKPRAFEQAVALAFTGAGCAARVVGGPGDNGVDVELQDGTVIQCKATSSPVGPGVVRDLLGAKTARNAPRAFCISRSGFTQAARDFAQKHGIELWTIGDLVDLQNKAVATAVERRNGSKPWTVEGQSLVTTIGKYTIESTGAASRKEPPPPSRPSPQPSKPPRPKEQIRLPL